MACFVLSKGRNFFLKHQLKKRIRSVSFIASHADVLRGSSRVPASRTSADVRGAGTRDEALRTSAWEAISFTNFVSLLLNYFRSTGKLPTASYNTPKQCKELLSTLAASGLRKMVYKHSVGHAKITFLKVF